MGAIVQVKTVLCKAKTKAKTFCLSMKDPYLPYSGETKDIFCNSIIIINNLYYFTAEFIS